jgi:hypothetical protein
MPFPEASSQRASAPGDRRPVDRAYWQVVSLPRFKPSRDPGKQRIPADEQEHGGGRNREQAQNHEHALLLPHSALVKHKVRIERDGEIEPVAVAGVASSGEVVARLHEAERQLLELGHDSSSLGRRRGACGCELCRHTTAPVAVRPDGRVAPDGVRG